MKKRIFCIVLCMIFCLSVIPFSVYAADIAVGDGWFIDASGCLHFTGKVTNPGVTDDMTPWKTYKGQITSAVAEKGSEIDSCAFLFSNCTSLTSVDLRELKTSYVINMKYMFYSCRAIESLELGYLNTSEIRSMSNMFSGCRSLKKLDLGGIDTGEVTLMDSMFSGCSSLLDLNIGGFDTAKVTTMREMFSGCSSLTSIDTGILDTRNVTDMSAMFENCSSLTSLDLRGFDTSKVTGMSEMFCGCRTLSELDLSRLDTSLVTNMSDLFNGCSALMSVDLDGIKTSGVKYMSGMFKGCSSLESIDLDGFDTSGAEYMSSMFEGCTSLTVLDIGSFDTSTVLGAGDMFTGCSELCEIVTDHVTLAKTAAQLISISPEWVDAKTGTVYTDETSLKAIKGSVTLQRMSRYMSDCGGDAARCAIAKFTDAPKYWAHEGVEFAVKRGLFGGMSETRFEPNTKMNRAMLVTVLYRFEGSPAAGTPSFTDVKSTQWYAAPVAWAAENGIVGGVGNGKFDPNGVVTREQIATILYRYSVYKGYDVSKRAEYGAFPDAGKVDSWAADAMKWAIAEQYIGGSAVGNATCLLPRDGATRAQVATILMRFVGNVEK